MYGCERLAFHFQRRECRSISRSRLVLPGCHGASFPGGRSSLHSLGAEIHIATIHAGPLEQDSHHWFRVRRGVFHVHRSLPSSPARIPVLCTLLSREWIERTVPPRRDLVFPRLFTRTSHRDRALSAAPVAGVAQCASRKIGEACTAATRIDVFILRPSSLVRRICSRWTVAPARISWRPFPRRPAWHRGRTGSGSVRSQPLPKSFAYL